MSDFSTDDSWIILSNIEQSIKQKILTAGTPLSEWNIQINYGIKTGLNEAFIISGAKRAELINEDPKSAEIIRPILRGRDIRRYKYEYADLWIIIAKFGSYKYLERKYPAIYHHLIQYKEALQKRGQCQYTSSGKKNLDKEYCGQHHWLELDNNPSDTYLNEFSKQKIVYREISDAMDACMVGEDIFVNNKCYLITGEHLPYLLAFFNSTLFTKIILPSANITGGKGNAFIESIPVKVPSQAIEQAVSILLDKRNSSTEAEKAKIDAQIDNIFFDEYGVTEEERTTLC